MALDPSVPRSIPYVRRRGSQLTVFLEYRRYGSFSVPCASQTSLPTFQKGEAELCASFPLRSHWISLRRCRSQWNTCVIRGVRSPRLVLCDKKIGFGHSFLLIMASSCSPVSIPLSDRVCLCLKSEECPSYHVYCCDSIGRTASSVL